MRAALGAIVLLSTSLARAADPLAAEAARRHDELLHQGFNSTTSVTVGAASQRLELIVLPWPDEHVLSLWFAAPRGTMTVRVLGPSGDEVAAWRGRSGEQRLTTALAPGRYVVEIAGGPGRGLVGVKGAVLHSCTLDSARVSEHAANPARGFHWPYLLLAPKSPRPGTLLVWPNNSGFLSEDVALLRAQAACELLEARSLADELGTPLLMPLFPRPAVAGPEENLYLHALSRAALTTQKLAWARVDRQLIAMIDDARAQLGGTIDQRVLIGGFSASGMFANRFAVLHPERLRAAAIGSPGGWPLAPVADAGFTYPVGIADVAALTGAPVDWAALRALPLFFFLGGDDDNDAVPSRDSFSAADETLLRRRFGATPVARWDAARQLYAQARLRAQFRLYPDAAHEITPAMHADIVAFFRAALRRDQSEAAPGR